MSDQLPPFGPPNTDANLLFPCLDPVDLSDEEVEVWTKRIKTRIDDAHTGSIPGGYTYLGQFIAHDLVPGDTARKVHPHLYLDSVYGNAREFLNSQGRFELGVEDPEAKGQIIDLPRDGDGKPLIADARNDDNVIVAQIHLAFQKIHNELMDRLKPSDPDPMALAAVVRKLCVYIFHRLVLDDFLPRILAPKVADFLLQRKERFLLSGPLKAVPGEFSRAAFRFGHSMVRQNYQLLNGTKSLDSLLNRGAPIPFSLAVDWDRLFGQAGGNTANGIDAEFARGLTQLKKGPDIINLAQINVQRSSGLSSGLQIAMQMRASPSSPNQWLTGLTIITHNDIERALGLTPGLSQPCPLWVYFLVEAMCHERSTLGRSEDPSEFPGRCLGPLASIIAGEVVLSGMEGAPFGALSNRHRIESELPAPVFKELQRLMLAMGRISMQALVREFSTCILRRTVS